MCSSDLMSALGIGAVAAGVSYTAIQIRSRSRVDDALDVFSCHGLAGAVGGILTGVLASRAVNPGGADGLLAGNAAQLVAQLLAVGAAAAFAALGTIGIVALVRATIGVRVGVEDEITGLDLSEHGEEAYFGSDMDSFVGTSSGLGQGVIVPAAVQNARAATVAAP